MNNEEQKQGFFDRLRQEHLKLWWAQRRKKYLLRDANRGEPINIRSHKEGGLFR